MAAAFLPSIFVPIVGLIFPAFSMALFFLYTQIDDIALIVNTPSDESSQYDMRSIRASAILHNIPCITTLQGAREAVYGIETMKTKDFDVKSLQDLYKAGRDVPCVAS